MQQTDLDSIQARKKLLRDRGICVIIPTYNNAGTIVDVVRRALEQCDDVIVVCDGCTDGTADLLRAMPETAQVLEFPVNRGKGIVLREGFRHALKQGFAYAITLDGDGQHFPEDIPLMLEANIKNPGALIVGCRNNLESVDRSGGSKFANSFSNFWFAVQTGHYLPDTQTGYRLYPLKKLHGLSLLTSRYEAELELMVFASWNGVKLVSTPVNVFYPPREERVSHFRPGLDFTRIFILNCVLCFLAIIYGLPRAILRFLERAIVSIYSLLIFLISVTLVLTPAMFLYIKVGGTTQKKKDRLHDIINWLGRFIMYRHGIPGCRITVDNSTDEDFSNPSVIICNHQSHLDLLPIISLTPKLIVLTADWVWKSPIYGFLIRNAEFLPASSGLEAILPYLEKLVKRGFSIVIYPEGTRSEDCSIGRFHQGAFFLADKLSVDILPIVIYGSGKALPKHGRYLRSWPIHTEVNPRIDAEARASMGTTYREQASAMRRFYIGRYNEIANKLEQDV